MPSALTIRQLVDRIVALGLVEPQVPARELSPRVWDETLDFFGEPDRLAVLGMLDFLGIRYTVDPRTFRGACAYGSDVYREELERMAACGRGLLSIADVELLDTPDGDHLLRFRCNGQPHEWPIGHRPDEAFEAQVAFATFVWDLVPAGSPARWCTVDPPDPDAGPAAVFADPEALRQLGTPFGLTFEPLGRF